MSETIITAPRLRMQAKVKGQGAPLVLVPGGLTGWDSWEIHSEEFAKERKAVSVQLLSVQYGLEGRGFPAGYSVGTESLALRETLDELGLRGPLDMAAWSYGAEIALDFSLDDPERIRTLALIEPPAVWVLGGQKPAGLEYDSLRELAGSLRGPEVSEARVEQFVRAVGLCPPGVSPRDLPLWRSWVEHRRSLFNTAAALGHCDDVARLRSFDKPVLIVKGTGSAAFLHQIADALAFELPRAQLLELPCGHAPHLASPERFREDLAAFQRTARA
ncbi:MAG: alpha/beta fold hydrolase [Endomicrobiales bacterium]